MLFLLFILTAINYLDRTNMAVAAPSMSSDLGFDAATMGLLFSAFAWVDADSRRLAFGTLRVASILYGIFVLMVRFYSSYGVRQKLCVTLRYSSRHRGSRGSGLSHEQSCCSGLVSR